MRYTDQCIDYAHAYTRDALADARHCAECSGVYMARALFGTADAQSRAEAVRAWRRVEAIASHIALHDGGKSGTLAAELEAAKNEAKAAREKLARARCADDLAVSADARAHLETLAAEADAVPETVRAAIAAGFVPASPDIDDLRARYEADVCALSPARISCAPRREGFTLNTGTHGGKQ